MSENTAAGRINAFKTLNNKGSQVRNQEIVGVFVLFMDCCLYRSFLDKGDMMSRLSCGKTRRMTNSLNDETFTRLKMTQYRHSKRAMDRPLVLTL